MNSTNIKYISTQDYSVSNEKFDLILDKSLDMLVTTPQPSLENLGSYYESKSYISHTDAKQSLLDRIYQVVKKHTIAQKIKLIELDDDFMLSEKLILDIGCGTGDFLVACKKKGWKTFGIEPNAKAKSIAEGKIESKLFSTIDEIESTTFDCITLWHVLEHVPKLNEYISKLKKLLKPNGLLIIAVPNFKSYDAMYYGKYWAAYDVPRHLWHFSKNTIQLLFEKERMKVEKILPMKFDAYYVSLLSENYKNKKPNPIRAFYIGCKSNWKAKKSKEYSSLTYTIKNNN
ncbi:MAG: class I SAM-dependent methyltransferase [Urechidicola sp.]|nr:class I SAM-dependent methyltransferase [Urechidicola sp.]